MISLHRRAFKIFVFEPANQKLTVNLWKFSACGPEGAGDERCRSGVAGALRPGASLSRTCLEPRGRSRIDVGLRGAAARRPLW